MVNKPKKKIARQQSSTDDQTKKRSGKPKGIKQNSLPLSGQWCEDLILRALIILLTMIGRFNNLHKTGTQSKQLEKSDQTTKLKNQIRKNLAQICGRHQKSDGTIVFFFNTKFESQNLDELFQEINLCSHEMNKTLIEKLGQMLELKFIKEIISFIRSGPDEPFSLFQEGGLENQFQVVQAYFVKCFLEHNGDAQEDVDFEQEFQKFKSHTEQSKIIEVYQKIAAYFLKQQNQYENESNKMIEHSFYEDSQYHGQFIME